MARAFRKPVPFKGQDYEQIKRYLHRTGQRFVDPIFPPDQSSLVYPVNSKIRVHGVEWKRPKDICPDPRLIVDGVSGNDLNQGKLANCWFIASCAAVAQKEEIWMRLMPDHEEQDYDVTHPESHPGIFHFRFWRFGQWIDVVIDDYLPTKNGKLYFVHSNDRNEFWSPLLEKAYAKVFGCYEALHLGSVTEALEDFTGGVAESVDLWKEQFNELVPKRKALFKMMKERIDKGALLGAFLTPKSAGLFEKTTPEGIVIGHAYGITAVNTVYTTSDLSGSKISVAYTPQSLNLVRLRNPWGFGEWNGRFSDTSPEWNSIDADCKKRIGLVFEDDGEFWMLMEDFCKVYNQMSFCHRVDDRCRFVVDSRWNLGDGTAGGSDKYPETFFDNPQICFDVTAEEDEVMLGLTVKTGQEQGDLRRHQLAIYVFRVEWNRSYRTHEMRLIVGHTMRLSFTVGLRCTLRQGRYLMVPCTRRPDVERQFIARVFTSQDNHARELHDLTQYDIMPKLITKLKVLNATHLENKLAGEIGSRLYVHVQCEEDSSQSQVVKDSFNPVWDAEFIFYRRKPLKYPIIIAVWDDMMFLGRHKMIAAEHWEGEVFELNLLDKDKVQVPGSVFVQITNTINLDQH